MSFTPSVVPIEVVRQGGEVFIRQAHWIDARVLGSSGVAESHTVPTGANFVVFSADGPFYANINGTAAIPAADVTNGTGSVYSPNQLYLGTDATTISLIAATANTVVTMSFYKN